MALTNTRERYGRVAQTFHWTTAALILALLPLGLLMTWLPQGAADEVALKVFAYSLHKTLGVTVLVVAVLRIGWALYCIKPAPLHPERRLETFAAETVHWLLYAGIVLAPVTGLLHHWTSVGFAPIWWPFGQDLPFVPKDERLSVIFGYAHIGTAIVITLAVSAHVAGALKHALVDRDKTLARMVAGEKAIIVAPESAVLRHGASLTAAGLVLVAVIGGASAYAVRETAPAQIVLAGEHTADAAGGDRADRWFVDYEASRLGITVMQLGAPVQGRFDQWRADIAFDPENLDRARVDVAVATGSLTVGTVSAHAVGSDFLDAETHPEAQFAAGTFRRTGEGAYEAEGTLTIRGVGLPFVLPFALEIEDGVARMTAAVTVDRMDFGIGAENYGSEEAVGFGIAVDIDLTATRTAPDAMAAN